MVLVIGAVVILSLFAPEKKREGEGTTLAVSMMSDLSSGKPSYAAGEKQGGMVLVTVWALTVTVFSCIQITIAKWLSLKRHVPGDIVGAFYMIVEGIIGTICLIISTW
jgi:hypothetical protein